MLSQITEEIVSCSSKARLIEQLKAAMIAWGSAYNNLSQAWAIGSVRDELQRSLNEALAIRELARAEYRKHCEEHGC